MGRWSEQLGLCATAQQNLLVVEYHKSPRIGLTRTDPCDIVLVSDTLRHSL